MRHSYILGAALVVLLVLPGAAHAQNREHMQIFADLRMLQEQIARLQQANTTLSDQIKAMNKRLDDEAASDQKHYADQQVLITGLSSSVNTVREKIDDNSVSVRQLNQEVGAIRDGIGMLTTLLNQMLGLLQPAAPPPGVQTSAPDPAAPAPGAVSMPPSPATYFNQAMSDFMSNRLDMAIDGFKDFIDKFPTATDAPKAQMHIADAYFQMGKYREAVAAASLVISKYKDSDRVPDAYITLGSSYQGLNQKADAQRAFEQVMKLYPNSNAAPLAKQRLIQMNIIKG
jgi:tol-pal system protein YbgF